MDLSSLDEIFSRTLSDRRLSRSERKALDAVLDGLDLDAGRLAVIRSRAFDAARGRIEDRRARELLDWIEEIVKLLARQNDTEPHDTSCAAYFSPGANCVGAIREFVAKARRSLWICVFTVTDDRISSEILKAHQRGIDVRILTDDEKSEDLGSDVNDLARAGVPVAVDQSDKHMHHKFALADGKRLLTGSYNWTRSAADHNEENVITTDDPRLVAAFAAEFERLWRKFA